MLIWSVFHEKDSLWSESAAWYIAALCGGFANLAWSLKDIEMCLFFNLTSVNQAHSNMYVCS